VASWEQWLAKYEAAYEAIPEDLPAACPNCGHDALRLVFTGNTARLVGWAAFWCDNCLQGITISRVQIPEGAVIRDIDQAPEHRRPELPDFEVVSA
jgi:hypothetical protein